jgi:hypothetical protein
VTHIGHFVLWIDVEAGSLQVVFYQGAQLSRPANGRFFEREGFAEAVQHLDRFPHDLGADAVTGQHSYLHFQLL